MKALSLISAGLLSLFILGGLVLIANETSAQEEQQVKTLRATDPNLKISEYRSDARIVGSYKDSGVTVSFSATAEVPATALATQARAKSNSGDDDLILPSSSSRVKVGTKSFTWTNNPKRGVVVLDGPDKPLTPQESLTLRESADEFWNTSMEARPKNKWSSEQMWLANTLAYLAEAPPGFKIEDSTENVGTESAANAEEFESGNTEQAEEVLATCQAAAFRSNDFASFASCAQKDEDGLFRFTCQTGSRNQSHDARDGKRIPHCFQTVSVNSGPCSSGCQGQCGEGCYGRGTWGGYYQDCHDHDRCSSHHNAQYGPFSEVCGDEFLEADDDFTQALNNYRKYGPNCRNCGDN